MFHSDPGALHVLHKCDNPTCVNPDHLFLGTNQDNVNDRKEKKRRIRTTLPGEKHGNAKLTRDAVDHIRKREMRAIDYALMYGVSKSTIQMIWNGTNWGHYA